MRGKSLLSAVPAAVCAGALFACAGVPAAVAGTPAATTLAGTAAPAVAQSHAAGAVSGSSRVNFELVMKLRDESGAEALVRAVSTPGGAGYRHYLTAAQWEARFSPTAAQIAQAKQWLTGEGFAVGAVSKDGITISASGTAAQVESAFDTSLDNYRIDGSTERMATRNLTVPSSLAGIVDGALGVNQYLATPADASNPDIPGSSTVTSSASPSSGTFPPAPPAFLTDGPCGAYYDADSTTVTPPFGSGYPSTVPDIVCGYKPAQLRSAYGLTSANTGAGTTVAIIDAYGSATIASDATTYFSLNDPSEPFSAADFQQIDQTPFDDESECGASGWATEQAIDVEAVHSMAPDAHILYVGGQDCTDQGLLASLQTVIDNGLANVVTNSYGDVGGGLLDDAATKAAYDDVFMLADATGITVQFSSGDDGDDFYLLGFSSAEYPADSPFATAVGGTTLEIGANGQREGELGWDTGRAFLCTANLVGNVAGCTSSALNTWLPASPDGSSGGYTSYYYLQPWYQAPVVPTSLSERNAPIFGPVPLRVVPDISLDADPGTGFLIGLHQAAPAGWSIYTQTRYGGTSLASPLLAGVVADADQAAGTPLGFINPALYRMDVAAPASILDVLPPAADLGNFRQDFSGVFGLGLTTAPGVAESFRELYYSGPEVYCDGTGNCASRPESQSAATGYDSLTGLGAPGTNFIDTLAAF